MSAQNPETIDKARRAQQKLAAQFLTHPDVSLIDIGAEPHPSGEEAPLVLRMHVRDRWFDTPPDEREAFPKEVDGFPVVVKRGEYRVGE